MHISTEEFMEKMPFCDSRYRSIISQLDIMIEMVSRRPGLDLMVKLDSLLTATYDHCTNEDSLMIQVGFPQAVTHHLHHLSMRINTDELLHRSRMGREVHPKELAYIRLLWMEHIAVHDRAFEEYLAT